MEINRHSPQAEQSDSGLDDEQLSDGVMTLTGTASLLVLLYLAVWAPLGVAFDHDNTAAIICPSLAIMILELINFIIVNETYQEESARKRNQFKHNFGQWTLASSVSSIIVAVIMFIWTSRFTFLVIMSIIGVVVSAAKNLSASIYVIIQKCINR